MTVIPSLTFPFSFSSSSPPPGASLPPSEPTGKPSVDVLKEGLEELVETCDLLDERVDSAIEAYKQRMARMAKKTGGGGAE